MYSGKKLFLIIFQLVVLIPVISQNLVWTGSAGDGAFFNEANWKNTTTNTAPPAGTIDPGVAINAQLTVQNASAVVGGTSGISNDIVFGTGRLTIRKSTMKLAAGKGIDMGNTANALNIDSTILTADFLKNASVTLSGDSKLYLSNINPFDTSTTINITSDEAWIFASNLNADLAMTSHVPRVKMNGAPLVDMTNARISQYYNGCAISAYSAGLAPLRFFDAFNLNGSFADLSVQTIYSGTTIPAGLNNKMVSFKLKKGYMATFAVNDDGTGTSKVYIASEADLVINSLPPALTNSVSFVRVLPWNWVNKKGTGGDVAKPLGAWFYNWGLGSNSSLVREYAPMSWGKTSLDTPAKRNTLIAKKKISHIMSFNEADNCNDQAGQYGQLCVVDTAALCHKNLMKTGLRIVSPSCRESEELNWLKAVNTKMIPAGTRMDVIGMHWYDWGGYSSGAASDANSIFNRFKNKVIAAYNYYKMPIWITEFNANKNRSREIQDAFLQLALPWLESTPYVERYAYFQPDGGNGSFTDANGNLTTTGTIYLNQVSTPSIPENYVNIYGNNLQSVMDETSESKNVVEIKERLNFQFNPANQQIIVKSELPDSIRLYNLQGMNVKQITPNESTQLSELSSGVYILATRGFHPEKILIY